MRSSYAKAGRTAYVSMTDGRLCGHQHETIRQARNCGGNAYRVIRPLDKHDRKNRNVSYKKVSA